MKKTGEIEAFGAHILMQLAPLGEGDPLTPGFPLTNSGKWLPFTNDDLDIFIDDILFPITYS